MELANDFNIPGEAVFAVSLYAAVFLLLLTQCQLTVIECQLRDLGDRLFKCCKCEDLFGGLVHKL